MRGANLSGADLSRAKLDGAIVESGSWIDDGLNPYTGQPFIYLDRDKWRVVREKGDPVGHFRVRPVEEPSEP